MNIVKYRVDADITDKHITSKLIFQGSNHHSKIHDDLAIISCKENVCNNVRNEYVENGLKNFFITIVDFNL